MWTVTNGSGYTAGMLRKCRSGIEWLEFLLLQPYGVKHGVFLRSGGVSSGKFLSLNGSFGVGDEDLFVKENRRRLQEVLGLKELAFVLQEHKKNVLLVESSQEESAKADAMITKEKEIGLSIQHADCQAALVYDPVRHVLGAVHAGWRGSVANIYKETIESLENQFRSQRKDLLVCVSPSLGPHRAEFIHYEKELPESFWKFQSKPLHFDFWEITKWQLLELGIHEEHIERAGMCTYEEKETFFSYRREKGVTGRHVTIGALL